MDRVPGVNLKEIQKRPRNFINVDHLSRELLAILNNGPDNKPWSIAISGEGNTGKSTLSSSLKRHFSGSASILEIDRYILGRKTRINLGLSAYDPRAIDLELYSKAIRELHNGNPIWAPYYDHQIGDTCDKYGCTDHSHTIHPSDLLITEGPFLWHPLLNINFSLKVYCENTQVNSFASRIMRDVNKRNYSESEARMHLKQLQRDAKTFIDPSKEYCNILIYIKENYSYYIEFI